ncbi:MAG: hypothetical protein HY595_03090, partial [Candidatus Omnitrophica bacterium]|nr:hypothetical protein [Candidatus Omnitrophota bacterium]
MLLFASTAVAEIPYYIAYQGKLMDATGSKAVTGSITIIFRLYDAETAGSELWKETHSVTLSETDSGVFSLTLGSVTALSSVDFNSPMWLSVQVSGDSEMTPRQRLTASGYALNADKLDSLDSTKFMRTDVNTSTSGKITITTSGTALLIKPTTDPAASTKLMDVQNAAGTSKFSVDLEGDVTVAGDTMLNAQGDLRFGDADSSNYVAFQGPSTVSTNVVWTLPNADGSANQVLTTDGSAALSWATASSLSSAVTGTTNASFNVGSGTDATATDVSLLFGTTTGQESLIFDGDSTDDFLLSDDLNIQTNTLKGTTAAIDFSSFDVDTSGNTTLAAQADLRLADADSSNYLALQAPTTVSSNVTWTFPSADGSANQVLTTDGSGALSWQTTTDISGTGDITSVAAGAGLTGGGTSGAVTLTVGEGTYLDINADDIAFDPTEVGSVTWGTANSTWTFAATSGTNPTVGWSNAALDIDATVTVDDIACETAGCIGATELGTDSVASDEIAADAVGSSEIATDAVGTAELVNFGTLTGTSGNVLVADGTDFESVAMSGDATIDSTGAVTVANDSHTHGSSSIGDDQLNFAQFTDSMSLDATTTIDMNATSGTDLILDDMSSAEQLILQNAQSTPDRADLYVADATSNRITLGDFVIAVSDSSAGVVIDTQGDANLSETGASPALTNTSDAREALAIASDVTATASDGVLKMGIKDSKWEYIWYNASEDKFILSATTRIESSSPAYLLFSPPTSSGSTPGSRYGIKFDPDVTPKTLSFVEITSPLSNPVENTLFEMKAGGRMALEFANLVKNGSFEAFSAMEEFHSYDAAYTTAATTATQFGGLWNQTAGFQGGWDNFAPDEWTWVKGSVFQHSPVVLGTATSTQSYTTDAAHGKSSVALKDHNASATYTTLADSPFPDGAIKQRITNLKPSTTYAVGVKALVTDAANTTAILDVDGEASGAGQLTKIGVSTAAALTTTATTYTDLVGVFTTSATADDVTIYLICKQTGTIDLTDLCRFDGVQVVASKSVPEFAPSTLVDTGDQTVYGSLRLGRTSDEKGGILSVDRFVRTRGIELFTDDPGITGKTGGGSATLGGSGIFPPGKGWNSTLSQQATVNMFVEGTYDSTAPPNRSYKVKMATNDPDKFSWWYSDDTTSWTETVGGNSVATPISVSTSSASAVTLNAGVKERFDSSTACADDDTW